MNAPCYNCKMRYSGCHSECAKYHEYKEKVNKLNIDDRSRRKAKEYTFVFKERKK